MRSAIVISIFSVSAVLLPGSTTAHDEHGNEFASEPIVAGFYDPTDFVIAPDGRIFVAELRGRVSIVENGVILPAPFIQLPTNQLVERGLVGIALDPDFSVNHYVYLFYTPETNPEDLEGPKTNRLIRVTERDGVFVPGSDVVLLGTIAGNPESPSCDDFPAGSDCLPQNGLSHPGGSLAFADDGSLFVSTGDGVWSGTDQAASLKAQDIDSLAGKILRINPRDGTGYPDNPFFDGDPGSNRSKVWAYGFRNPFKFTFIPGMPLPLVGNVGWESFEELELAPAGANLGWPCLEGLSPVDFYDSELCVTMWSSPPASLLPPIYQFSRGDGAAVIGGVFTAGVHYPAEFQGAFFFGEFVTGEIRAVRMDLGQPIGPDEVHVVASADGPVAFRVGLDGFVYYLSFGSGELLRLVHTATNVAPQVRVGATPIAGLAPLMVAFSSKGTADANGDELWLQWDFGDGNFSNEPNPVHVYTSDGSYTAKLTATDPSSATGMASVEIIVGEEPPAVRIVSPPDGFVYNPGTLVNLQGEAIDPEDGLLAPEALHWTIRLHHCGEDGGSVDCHYHPFLIHDGDAIDFTAPDHGDGTAGDFFFIDVELSAQDSDGLVSSTSIEVGPDQELDGCMDFYVPHQEFFAPFDANADGTTNFDGGAFAFESHTAIEAGGARLVAAAVAPAAGGAAAGGALATLENILVVDEADKYGVYFDADVIGSIGVVPGSLHGRGQLLFTAELSVDGSANVLRSRTLAGTEVVLVEPGPVGTAAIFEVGRQWVLTGELEPNDYVIGLGGAAAVDVVSNSGEIIAFTELEMVLRRTLVCKQRVPDEILP